MNLVECLLWGAVRELLNSGRAKVPQRVKLAAQYYSEACWDVHVRRY